MQNKVSTTFLFSILVVLFIVVITIDRFHILTISNSLLTTSLSALQLSKNVLIQLDERENHGDSYDEDDNNDEDEHDDYGYGKEAKGRDQEGT